MWLANQLFKSQVESINMDIKKVAPILTISHGSNNQAQDGDLANLSSVTTALHLDTVACSDVMDTGAKRLMESEMCSDKLGADLQVSVSN